MKNKKISAKFLASLVTMMLALTIVGNTTTSAHNPFGASISPYGKTTRNSVMNPYEQQNQFRNVLPAVSAQEELPACQDTDGDVPCVSTAAPLVDDISPLTTNLTASNYQGDLNYHNQYIVPFKFGNTLVGYYDSRASVTCEDLNEDDAECSIEIELKAIGDDVNGETFGFHPQAAAYAGQSFNSNDLIVARSTSNYATFHYLSHYDSWGRPVYRSADLDDQMYDRYYNQGWKVDQISPTELKITGTTVPGSEVPQINPLEGKYTKWFNDNPKVDRNSPVCEYEWLFPEDPSNDRRTITNKPCVEYSKAPRATFWVTMYSGKIGVANAWGDYGQMSLGFNIIKEGDSFGTDINLRDHAAPVELYSDPEGQIRASEDWYGLVFSQSSKSRNPLYYKTGSQSKPDDYSNYVELNLTGDFDMDREVTYTRIHDLGGDYDPDGRIATKLYDYSRVNFLPEGVGASVYPNVSDFGYWQIDGVWHKFDRSGKDLQQVIVEANDGDEVSISVDGHFICEGEWLPNTSQPIPPNNCYEANVNGSINQ